MATRPNTTRSLVLGPASADRRGRRDRGRGERGAVFVEFALIVPILLALIFAITDLGNFYFQQLSVRNDTQAVARLAAVANFGTDSSCTPQGGTWSGNERNLLCRMKNEIDIDDKTNIRVKIVLPDGAFAKGNRLIICTQHAATSLSGVYAPLFSNKFLRGKSMVRIEQSGTLTAAEETAPSGSSWTFCA